MHDSVRFPTFYIFMYPHIQIAVSVDAGTSRGGMHDSWGHATVRAPPCIQRSAAQYELDRGLSPAARPISITHRPDVKLQQLPRT